MKPCPMEEGVLRAGLGPGTLSEDARPPASVGAHFPCPPLDKGVTDVRPRGLSCAPSHPGCSFHPYRVPSMRLPEEGPLSELRTVVLQSNGAIFIL